MIHAIFIITVTFWAKTKFQIISIQFCSSAYGAFMPSNYIAAFAKWGISLISRLTHLPAEINFSLDFMGRDSAIIPCCKKENKKVAKWNYQRNYKQILLGHNIAVNIIQIHKTFKYCQPFCFYRNKEIYIKCNIRK